MTPKPPPLPQHHCSLTLCALINVLRALALFLLLRDWVFENYGVPEWQNIDIVTLNYTIYAVKFSYFNILIILYFCCVKATI